MGGIFSNFGQIIYEFMIWFWRLVYVNILWMLFTILGLGFFGFFPSTVSLFTVVRKWQRGEAEVPIFKTFKNTYFKEWKRSNKLGMVYYLIFIFLFIDVRITQDLMNGLYSLTLILVFWLLAMITILSMFYFFATYAHYDYTDKQQIIQPFLFSISGFKTTFFIVIGMIFIKLFIYKVPGLMPFLSMVLPAFWIMKTCLVRFEHMEGINRPERGDSLDRSIEFENGSIENTYY